MRLSRYLMLAMLMSAALWGLGISNGMRGGLLAQAQAECTVTVQPGESIQQAIDQAQEGDVICLGEGEWQENLVIEKILTLRGAGQDKSIIKGKEEGRPVIHIASDSEIEVTLEGLTVTGAKGDCVDWPNICPHGLLLGGRAKATLSNSTISGNRWSGIWMRFSSQATISDSEISGNGSDGIRMWDFSQAEISDSIISGNGWGIRMEDSSQATISGSQISENGLNGIEMAGSQATISGSTISENGRGIVMGAPRPPSPAHRSQGMAGMASRW